MTLNRKTHKAYNRVREGNFSLENLTGFDLYHKTVGVIGTGKIGGIFAKIMLGLGCKVLAYDMFQDEHLTAAG
ncbi:NAD(P)-dependent oxidoreductase, partial [Mycobacterium tuberculosis]